MQENLYSLLFDEIKKLNAKLEESIGRREMEIDLTGSMIISDLYGRTVYVRSIQEESPYNWFIGKVMIYNINNMFHTAVEYRPTFYKAYTDLETLVINGIKIMNLDYGILRNVGDSGMFVNFRAYEFKNKVSIFLSKNFRIVLLIPGEFKILEEMLEKAILQKQHL